MNFVTTISLSPVMKEWLDKRGIKVSAFVQQCIIEAQERETQNDNKKLVTDYDAEIKKIETDKGVLVRFIQVHNLMEDYLEWKKAIENPQEDLPK